MARFKLDVQKKQHRERSQPLQRKRLGLLEKHSDYVQRAKDYNSKKDRLQKLRLKASLKNQDEFYFKMINSKTVKGVHYNFNKTNTPLDNQLVKLLKTQDFNYIKTCRAIEENKITKLKERLGSMIIRVQSEESGSSSDLKEQAIQLINQSITATHAKNTANSDQGGSELDHDDHALVKPGKKTIFVDSVEEVKNFSITSLGKKTKKDKTQSASKSSSKKTKGKFTEEFSDAEDQLTPDPEKHMRKLMTEFQTRLTRLRVLQTAEREMELKKSLMGKGSKFLKFRSSTQKPKQDGLVNGRDLSWYDKLDRNQIIEDDLERERLEKLNSGIKTGAQVWKWKQERKK
ncbi:hypothetical protein PGTUg99_001463 [Puccinia graminis f. sp. tritici]|uniref:U3 small nucleolar RNA-associated protein 11 n=1 Tax=Puccinia graminis f. sp. tritici TaxID=56615 RepID=A0A5B0M8T1_PUCGR|nr:hypothetical protein PGTUg99_001463 [Puccinia graminis f. sp. tritici]